MSCKGHMNVEVRFSPRTCRRTVLELEAKAAKLADGPCSGWSVSRRGDEAALVCDTDQAGWLEDEMRWLAGELAKLGVSPDGWSARILYESYDGTADDGARVEITVSDGRISGYEESRLTLVPKEAPPEIVAAFGRLRPPS